MYQELVKALTTEQVDELHRRGIARSTVSAWKHGKRIPTRPQTVHLAQVCQVDVMTLEKELMVLEAAPEQRDLFQQLIGLAASIFLVLGMFGTPSNASADQGSQTLKRGEPSIHRGKCVSVHGDGLTVLFWRLNAAGTC